MNSVEALLLKRLKCSFFSCQKAFFGKTQLAIQFFYNAKAKSYPQYTWVAPAIRTSGWLGYHLLISFTSLSFCAIGYFYLLYSDTLTRYSVLKGCSGVYCTQICYGTDFYKMDTCKDYFHQANIHLCLSSCRITDNPSS